MNLRKIVFVFMSFCMTSITAQKLVSVSEAIELALENNYGIKNSLRVTIGKNDENKKLILKLKKVINV